MTLKMRVATLFVALIVVCNAASANTHAQDVRGDVRLFILKEYNSGVQQAAAMQLAKAIQRALTVNTTDVALVRVIDSEIEKAISCIYSSFDAATSPKHPAQVAEDIVSLTTNTKQRLLAYLYFNKVLDGTTSTLPEGYYCE